MAISTSVGVTDNMSAAFMNITNAINVCLGTFVDLQSATAEGISAGQMENVHNALNEMNAAAALFIDEVEDANNATGRLPSNIEEANNRQKAFNESAKKGDDCIDKLGKKIKQMVGAYAGWQAGKKVLELSDDLASTTARIDMMNDGVKTTEEVMDRIYASAQNARGGYMEMASVVAKLGNNAKDAFSSTDEIINFANLVQKEFAIAGASTTEASNAMLQLTQALGSGVLRGDELRSIFEQAPNLIQDIADYMNVPIGKIRDMASEGMISAEIVKNAIFEAADRPIDSINEKFANMPMTFSQAATGIKNAAIVAFQPFLNMLGSITGTEEFATLGAGLVTTFQNAATAIQPILQWLVDGGAWVVNNWSMLAPVLAGVTGALAAYVGWQAISKALDSEGLIVRAASAVATLAHGAALIFLGIATANATAIQMGFNMVLNACPLMLIVTLIGIVIMAIARWVQSVGGIKIAWAIVVDKVLYNWDLFKLGFMIGVHAVMNLCDKIKFAFQSMGYHIATFVRNMKVNVLTIIQDMVNGAISLINDFIGLLNKIPGVSIDAISYTASFGTEAAANAAKEQAAAKADLDSKEAKMNKNAAERAADDAARAAKAASDHNNRLAEIKKDQQEAKAEKNNKVPEFKMPKIGTPSKVPEFKMPKIDTPSGGAVGDIAGNTKDTAANTKKAADSLEVTEDNLVWLKDIAEREIIDRTIFRDTTVNLGGVKNTVKNMTDLDGIAEYLGNVIAEQMQTQVEGVH